MCQKQSTEQSKDKNGKFRDFRNATKGCYIRVLNSKRERISEQVVPSGLSDGGHQPAINLKELSKYVPYQHFKIEELYYLKLI